MEKFIVINNQRIDYLVEIKPNNKTIRLVIKTGKVIVRHNGRVRQSDVERLFYNNSKWILDKLAENDKRKANPSDDRFFYLGKSYKIKYHQSVANEIKLIDDECHIYIADLEAERDIIKKHFYINCCTEFLPELVEKWQNKMQLFATRIRVKQLKSKWGSCNHSNALVFNSLLMQLPVEAIEYIVVHELAHIAHKNHSVNFWQCVGKYIDNYKEINKEIRQYEKMIHGFASDED